ncbi:MAG: aminopeptidase [Candidatus Cloacimonetes bacterium]|nr:aminopeptidase [Candidatus Cloacimonadota bacterium]
MYHNVFSINSASQLKSVSTELNLNIINELVMNPATCQQLSNIFGLSKQKVHYNLKKLLVAGLIRISDKKNGDKEVYYQAIAKNFVIDFSMGSSASKVSQRNNRELINKIIEEDHNLDLLKIAANILDNSLKMSPREKLLIVTGECNMPLVKKILVEADKRQIDVTLLYENEEFIRSRKENISLAAYNFDMEKFIKHLKESNVYLNLNGESRLIPLNDPEKRKMRQKAYAKCGEIIAKNKIKVVLIQGLISNELHEKNILFEINFWKSLSVNYERLEQETSILSKEFQNSTSISIKHDSETKLDFEQEKLLCDFGSFTNQSTQSPIMSIPGGEVLLFPKENSLNGIIKLDCLFLQGEKVINPVFKIEKNKIVEFSALTNEELIKKVIDEGGEEGRTVSLICFGTNYNLKSSEIDISFNNLAKGNVAIYFGDNTSLGGKVKGLSEWLIHIDKPEIQIN